MFHVPSDVIVDHRFNVLADNNHYTLNLIQMEHLDAIPPSPENTPSSSPASLSCSSLNAWRSTSDQLQTPIFSLPGPICRNFGAITANSSDEPSKQRISCVQMSAFDAASSQEPAIPAIDEGELEDLRWTTGVPYHMIDVFRANPFTAMDVPPVSSTTPPSLDNSTNPDTAECKIASSHRARSAAKHILSPDAVEQKRKTRTKRARIQSPPVVPFPATGPLQMFAYEFRLDTPHEGTGFSPAEEYRKCGDLPPSYLLSRGTDGHDHLFVSRPVLAYNPEDAFLHLPVGRDWSESCMQQSHLFPTSMPLPTQRSTYLEDPPNPAISTPSQGLDDSTTRFERYGYSPLPPTVPIRVIPERAQTFRPSLVPVGPLIQKPLYACPLCPRDFQLPNGLALHLKWHDRVGNLATNSTSHLNYRPPQAPMVPRAESAPLNARDMSVRCNQQGTILPSSSYAPQKVINSAAQTESVSTSLGCSVGCFLVISNTLHKVALSGHGQFTSSAQSYERRPQECALFHDVLQSNHNAGFSFDNNTYLAPLDGLSVLQPLPFEQCHTTTGQLCSLPPS
jgi:hypothetical protein